MKIWIIDFSIVFSTVIIFGFIIFTIVIFRLDLPLDNYFKEKKFTEIRKYIKSGDLFAISYTNIRGKLVKVFTGSTWTHVGMYISKNNKEYILEMARYDSNQNGIILKNFDEWYDWNCDYIISYRPYLGPDRFPKKKLCAFLEKMRIQNPTPDLNVVSWLKTMIQRKYENKHNPYIKDKYYCSEFIAYALQEIGVLKKKMVPSSYKPWQLLYGCLSTTTNHKYGSTFILQNDM
jgi:hypothetical protein